jgi:hypothetical protein
MMSRKYQARNPTVWKIAGIRKLGCRESQYYWRSDWRCRIHNSATAEKILSNRVKAADANTQGRLY